MIINEGKYSFNSYTFIPYSQPNTQTTSAITSLLINDQLYILVYNLVFIIYEK